jgi:hypothetical protein
MRYEKVSISCSTSVTRRVTNESKSQGKFSMSSGGYSGLAPSPHLEDKRNHPMFADWITTFTVVTICLEILK